MSTETNGAPTMDALTGAREWLAERDEHRQRLEAELREYEAKAREIREVLAQFGSEAAASTSAAPMAPVAPTPRPRFLPKLKLPDPKRTSVPEAITAVISENPGQSSGEIVKSVVMIKPDAKATTVFPTLYRMRDDGRLATVGKRYFLPQQTSTPSKAG
jgi:hypothetical protein